MSDVYQCLPFVEKTRVIHCFIVHYTKCARPSPGSLHQVHCLLFYKVLTDHSLWSIRTPSKVVFHWGYCIYGEVRVDFLWGIFSENGGRLIHSFFSAYFVIIFQSVLQQ